MSFWNRPQTRKKTIILFWRQKYTFVMTVLVNPFFSLWAWRRPLAKRMCRITKTQLGVPGIAADDPWKSQPWLDDVPDLVQNQKEDHWLTDWQTDRNPCRVLKSPSPDIGPRHLSKANSNQFTVLLKVCLKSYIKCWPLICVGPLKNPIYLADPAKARGCSTNTSLSNGLWKYVYGAATPIWLTMGLSVIK